MTLSQIYTIRADAIRHHSRRTFDRLIETGGYAQPPDSEIVPNNFFSPPPSEVNGLGEIPFRLFHPNKMTTVGEVLGDVQAMCFRWATLMEMLALLVKYHELPELGTWIVSFGSTYTVPESGRPMGISVRGGPFGQRLLCGYWANPEYVCHPAYRYLIVPQGTEELP